MKHHRLNTCAYVQFFFKYTEKIFFFFVEKLTLSKQEKRVENRCRTYLEDGKLTDKWYLTWQKGNNGYLQDHRGESTRSKPEKVSLIEATASSKWKSLEGIRPPIRVYASEE